MDSSDKIFAIEILKANNYFELYSGYSSMLYFYNNRNNTTFIISKNNNNLGITRNNTTELYNISEIFKKINEYEI